MLLRLTLLSLSVVKVNSNSLFDPDYGSIWKDSQVYIYKREFFHGRQEMEEIETYKTWEAEPVKTWVCKLP